MHRAQEQHHASGRVEVGRDVSATGLGRALQRRAAVPEQRPLLSPRESQVLRLLEEGQSVPEVALELFVSLSTAKTYVARLYEKLGATNRAQALMAAVRLDLVQTLRSVPGPPQADAG